MSGPSKEREDFSETVCARCRTRMALVPSDRSLGALRFPAGQAEASSCSPLGVRIAVCEASRLVLIAGKTFCEVLWFELWDAHLGSSQHSLVDRYGGRGPWGCVGPSLNPKSPPTLSRPNGLGGWADLQLRERSLGTRGLREWSWEPVACGTSRRVARCRLGRHFASSPQAGQATKPSAIWGQENKQTFRKWQTSHNNRMTSAAGLA